MDEERVLRDFLRWISNQSQTRRDCGVPYSCLSAEIGKYLEERRG